uniref:Uncharacterized protein n=1 Tax=Roseihalotalea indica TaxID=2867963 RepID=A0AA49JDZ2_9BACT|nr:hypothetical protein K4G66_29680 [Tunicatimonas sp. TK19036]
MVTQHAFTFLAPVVANQVESLRRLLHGIVDKDVESNQWFPFIQMETIHFARLLILDQHRSERKQEHHYPAYLVFSTNYDGELNDHLREVVEKSGDGFREVFGHCENGPAANATTDACIKFLKKHSDYRAYFYIGIWGKTVLHIRHEEKIRQLAETFLDEQADRTLPPQEIWQSMVAYFKKHELLSTIQPVAYPQFARPRILFLSVVALIFLPIWILLLLFGLIMLRLYELFEKPFQHRYSNAEKTQGVASQEDHIVQNQLTHLVEIKFSPFRGMLLKVVLTAIQLLSVYKYNKGKLGNIPTIHFARWVRIDGGKRLLFFSNYDGSWESYLGDFIDKASVGLTGVWSNTRWFPRTLLLLLRGARDEQRFKAWTRAHQVYTDVWYSAYKNLSVRNILNNSLIYQGLLKSDMTEAEAKQWLALF